MNKPLFIFTICIMLIFSSACSEENYEVLSENTESIETSFSATEEAVKIGVYVCGEVMRPGIYYFCGRSRIEDAIEAAGGITANASIDSMNLAEYLKDCDKVYVPAVGEELSENLSVEVIKDDRVDLNQAGLEELMTLPGIGQSKAQSIIDYRDKNGGYTCVEDIMNITGIKEGVFNKIKDLIKV